VRHRRWSHASKQFHNNSSTTFPIISTFVELLPFLAMVKFRVNSCIHIVIKTWSGLPLKSNQLLLTTRACHLAKKFYQNSSKTFWVLLQRDRQTVRQTNTQRQKHNILVGCNICLTTFPRRTYITMSCDSHSLRQITLMFDNSNMIKWTKMKFDKRNSCSRKQNKWIKIIVEDVLKW